MKLIVNILLLTLLVSCNGGGSSSGDNSPQCLIDATKLKDNWQDTNNNDIYNLKSCEVNQECAYCVGSCGDSTQDFKIKYNNDEIILHRYFYNSTLKGTWELCDNELKINWNDNNTDKFVRVE